MSEKISIRLFDFRIYNEDLSEESDDEGETKQYIEKKDKKETIIQMFGMNEEGETFAINVMNFKPFFYVKVPLYWDLSNMKDFERKVNKKIGNYYSESVNKFKLITKKKLYGFDNNKYYNFIKISFKNTTAFNKVKALWYTENDDFRKRKLIDNGYERTILYEAKLPPLLRFFHINDISPSGWISFNENDIDDEIEFENQTCCDNEYWIDYKTIRAEKKKETAIPLKICSFDIEASSSHGDFPLAKKTYLKLCRQIVIYWTKNRQEIRIKSPEEKQTMLIELIYAAHGYSNMEGIDKIYLKKETTSKKKINKFINKIIFEKIKKYNEWPKRSSRDETDDIFNISKKKTIIFKNKEVEKRNIINLLDSKEDIVFKSDILNRIFTGIYNYSKIKVNYLKDGIKINKPGQIINIDDLTLDLNEVEKKFVKGRIEEKPKYRKASSHYFDSLIIIPELCLPFVEGDTVTFIGSTFMRLGEKEQYLNNMIVLNSCSDCPDVPNCEIETYEKEKDVLLAWTRMIQREDPDIVIGYNIFGFDYKFMIERAEELGCKAKFLQLGRLLGEQSRVIDSSIKIASGTHDLKYIKMEGRIQIDLYNHFRREINLPSYKLDNVASHFIGDIIKDITNIDNKTVIKSKNMMGLKNGHYICFEILGHSTDKYKQGKKFIVEQMNSDSFVVNSRELAEDLKGKKCRWCLAKDDVTPQDIFRLTNEGPDERAIIAKYCFQDCNLVHNLMMKNDIFTGMSEIANICYVPVEFIVMRGQGIKLLSFIAKKCSEKNTLMPVLDVEKGDSSYEGAICLKPYCGLYIDNPVAVVDYASLYPSSMISENISHDSKVWTKEYDMKGNIVTDNMGNEGIHGIRDKEGNFKYDNLEGYEYVDITYDRYIWRNKGKGKAREKVKVGTKTCRFAQFPEGKKAIMPAVLHELLAGRKATRKFIKYKTVSLKNGEEYDGLYSVKNEKCKVVGEKETWEFDEADVSNVKDTYDDFMKNVFDKRQQGLKVTANSLYGQTGARTSSFYEMDIAASTTATGRKLLIYGKKIIEGIYGNKICDTTYGKIRCKSKVVYGDTDSCFMTFNAEELDGTKITGKKALDITIQLAIECGEIASKFLKPPHDLEYEKTFDPFLLLSKKRYVGMLYEHDVNKCKRKSMGIVLKRRDNAPVVKDIYGGIIDIIMKSQDIEAAVLFTKSFLKDIIDEKIPLDKLIITKSLREFYKCPESIAHKVLADRMGKRDPGNKPSTGSRIPFIYIKTKKKVKLQGERIEHPDYIKEHGLKPDYKIYITNQIMKPVMQIYALVLEQLKIFKRRKKGFERKVRSLERKWKDDDKKCVEYIMKERNKHVKELLFNDILRVYDNKQTGQKTITSLFGF